MTYAHAYIYERSVKLVVPHLHLAVLRKPVKKDIDTISPRYLREPL